MTTKIPKKLTTIANFFGYSLVDQSTEDIYSDRKGDVFGIRDRRTGMYVATYSTQAQIKNFLRKLVR